MLAQTQGLPNYLGVLANAVVLVSALYGFYRFAIRNLTKLVNEQMLPPLDKHIEADNKQVKATNKVLRKLEKSLKAHEKRDDASFRAVKEQLARIEANGSAPMMKTAR